MTKENNIIVPRWFLENVENTLQIQNNINLDKKTEETCQDRNVREFLNGLHKLLKGEELTGMERLEKLQPSLPSNINEAANKFAVSYDNGTCDGIAQDCFKAGAKWMAGQYKTLGETEIYLEDDGEEAPYTQTWLDLDTTEFAIPEGFESGDKVIVQIRKIEGKRK